MSDQAAVNINWLGIQDDEENWLWFWFNISTVADTKTEADAQTDFDKGIVWRNLKQLGNFFQNVILFSHADHFEWNILVWSQVPIEWMF